MTDTNLSASRRKLFEQLLADGIRKVLEDAAEKGGVTLTPVAVAGQVMPELVALCWHFLDSHKGFHQNGENAMGEQFLSQPR